jgi:3-dehydroquinate synthase
VDKYNEFCLPHIPTLLETELTIEIIEFEAGEENKTLIPASKFGMFSPSLLTGKSCYKSWRWCCTDLGGFVAQL